MRETAEVISPDFLKRKERYERNAHRRGLSLNKSHRSRHRRFSFACHFGISLEEKLRWVNSAMAFATFLACLAVFAVKLRCVLCVSVGCGGIQIRIPSAQHVKALMGLRFTDH